MYPSNQKSVTRPRLCQHREGDRGLFLAVGSDVMELKERRRRREGKGDGRIGVVWILFLNRYVTLSRAVDTQVSTE